MSHHLLELSFGPVQGFIASARRSRDLWAGSYILSELARAAGTALVAEGAELIYPLKRRVERENPNEDSNLSNVLLATVPIADAEAVRRIAEVAKQAAHDKLKHFADQAWAQWNGAGVKLRQDFWNRQVADAIEAYAAWSAIGADGYRPAYERLKKAFAARKNTRDFAPMFEVGAKVDGAGIPKCSFDGLRESVLPERRKTFPPRFGLSEGEQLDALGCIKRVVGRQEKFTALTRLAADGWLAKLDKNDLAELNKTYAPLVEMELATRANGNADAYANFPFDGGLLYPERLEAAKREVADDKSALTALQALEKTLKPLWSKKNRPCPYAVLMVADGDRMGKFVDKAQSAEDHRRISDAVATFADQVPDVARKHAGHSIFNGGEDLTVLFPLAGIVPGALELARVFRECMKPVVDDMLASDEDARPTLRVGAAICHVLEPLGVIRTQANAAEKFAKGEAGMDKQGNALGLRLHIRAGHEIGIRFGFDDADGFAALKDWQTAYGGSLIPGRLAYDTRAIALHCQAIGTRADVAEGEFRHLLARARQGGGGESIPGDMRQKLLERQAALAAVADATDPGGLFRLADELILARWLSAATAGDISSLEGGE